MSRIITHKRLDDGSLKHNLRSRNRQSKAQWVEEEISIVQLIQLGFSRLLGSATSNEANKRVMLQAETQQSEPLSSTLLCSVWPKWNILSHDTAIRKQFSHSKAIMTGHISIYRQTSDILSVGSTGLLQLLSDWGNFKITLHIKKAPTPNFQNSYFSILCKGWLQCITSVMQGLPTLQNHLCQIGNSILPEYEKLKLDHFKSTHIKPFTRIEVTEL